MYWLWEIVVERVNFRLWYLVVFDFGMIVGCGYFVNECIMFVNCSGGFFYRSGSFLGGVIEDFYCLSLLV